MLAWSTIPYAVWQLSYYFFITVRRREKIAAGRPTSFTWLRRSYSKVWIGKFVLSLPDPLQEPAFMLIQYCYAVLTMLPCPLWFYSRWASATFLMVVFAWSVYNGATYYIDVFGKRFQKELEVLRLEVQKWQTSPDLMVNSPLITPNPDGLMPSALQISSIAAASSGPGHMINALADEKAAEEGTVEGTGHSRNTSVDHIPLLSEESIAEAASSGVDNGTKAASAVRKIPSASA
jgi:hypothetical protein